MGWEVLYLVDMRGIESRLERTGRTLDLNYCQGNQLIKEVYLSNKLLYSEHSMNSGDKKHRIIFSFCPIERLYI